MQANYNTVTFNTTLENMSVGYYQTFIQSLRRELFSGTTSYDIPLLRKKSEAIKDKQFVYVRLENYKNFKITFAVSTLNCYMIAYQVDTKKRCYFFKEAPPEAKTLLFKESTQRVNVNLSTNYNNLGNRENVNLGFKSLDDSLKVFTEFDSVNPTNKLRQILIVVIQMVAEAARSKYIQEKMEWKGFKSGFFPKGDILSYENKWEDLSKAIQNSKDGSFPKIKLQNEDYSDRYVSKVTDVKKDMALLLNIAA